MLSCSYCGLFSHNSLLDKKELSPYVTEFMQEGRKRYADFDEMVVDFDIQFGDLPEGKAGSCKKLKRLVTINPDLWNLMDSIQRQALVFHELAHCVLGSDHNDNTLPRGECVSLMVGSASDSTCYYDFYSSHWKTYYLDELFEVEQGIPTWYYDDIVLLDTDLDSLLIDTATINHFNWRMPNEILESDYQITIDSFNQNQLVSIIDMRWVSYLLNIDVITGTLEVKSLNGADAGSKTRRIVPRIFQTDQIPDLIRTVTLRRKRGFYDIFLNDQLAYRSSGHSKGDFRRELIGVQLYSEKLRVINSSLKIYSLHEDKVVN